MAFESSSAAQHLRQLLGGDGLRLMPCCFDARSALAASGGEAAALEEPIWRLNAFADLGAEVLPPERLEAMGFRIAAYPLTLLACAAAAMQAALADLAAGRTPAARLDFASLRRLVGFEAYDALLASDAQNLP